MATRDRTVLFIQYRNSFAKPASIKPSRINQGNQFKSDDQESLLSPGRFQQSSIQQQQQKGDHVTIELKPLPPQWMDTVDQVEEIMKDIQAALNRLEALQKKSILTSFDDTDDLVDQAASQITQMFSNAQNQIKRIGLQTMNHSDTLQQQLGKNAQSGLASKLGELSARFRQIQNQYLQKIRGRDDKANQYLIKSGLDAVLNSNTSNDLNFTPSFTQQQLAQINQQTETITQREKQIEDIAKNILQLSEIFRDLQTLVIDQGTILDRIDYNIELVKNTVEPAFQELQKAEEYQKNTKAKYCIYFLIILISILLLVVMVKPKKK